MNDTVEGQGKAVVLPNGVRRIDFIRDAYYTDGVHTEGTDSTRSEIKKAINTMLEEAKTGLEIPYQIVFAATRDDVDPRIAAEKRSAERAEAKAEREKAKAEAKAEKDAEKAAKKAEAKKKAAEAAKGKGKDK